MTPLARQAALVAAIGLVAAALVLRNSPDYRRWSYAHPVSGSIAMAVHVGALVGVLWAGLLGIVSFGGITAATVVSGAAIYRRLARGGGVAP